MALHPEAASRPVSGLEILGFVRFVLATSVSLFHLWTPAFPDAGRHAVAGFFCISGFLITMIARESYNDRPIAFVLNRALRIYPTYWACLAIAVAIGALFPETIKIPGLSTNWPANASGWINNVLILSLADAGGRVISQSWSLEVELYFYLIIGLCTYRSFTLTACCFGFTMIYAVLSIYKVVPTTFYWSPYGAAFMFFAGSMAYFVSRRVNLGWPAIIGSMSLYAVMMYGVPLTLTPASPSTAMFYFHIVISAAAAAVLLAALPSVSLPDGRWVRSADYLGRLSYPIFLPHIFTAVPVVAAIGWDSRSLVFFLSFGLLLGSAAAILALIEFPVEKIRRAIRAGGIVRRAKRPAAAV